MIDQLINNQDGFRARNGYARTEEHASHELQGEDGRGVVCGRIRRAADCDGGRILASSAGGRGAEIEVSFEKFCWPFSKKKFSRHNPSSRNQYRRANRNDDLQWDDAELNITVFYTPCKPRPTSTQINPLEDEPKRTPLPVHQLSSEGESTDGEEGFDNEVDGSDDEDDVNLPHVSQTSELID